jgi:hypothetical protein
VEEDTREKNQESMSEGILFKDFMIFIEVFRKAFIFALTEDG